MRRFFLVVAGTLLSGFLFAAALPPADFQILGWFCFVPMLAALRDSRLIFSILAPLGMALFAAYVTTTGILYDGPKLEGDEAWHYAGFVFFGVAISPALIVMSCLKQNSLRTAAWLAALFVCAESLLLLYLPAHLALTQYRSPAMLWLASWGGIWGVSYLLWLIQIYLASSQLAAIRGGKKWAVWLSAAALVAVGLWKHGAPGPNNAQEPRSGVVRLAAIQTSLPDFERLATWNEEARQALAEVVVWPELSAAGIAAGGRTERLVELSARTNQPAFVTTFPDDSKPKPFNTASVFAAGKESLRYQKRKPFGGEAQDHQAGSKAVATRSGEHWIGLNICFDSCYPSIMRETAAAASQIGFIVLPCMGPESPYGVIQAIHGAFTPFRSAELGVAIARGESSAYAMITDQNGRIVAEAPPGFEGVIWGDVGVRSNWTLIKQVGDWFLYACWLAIPIGALQFAFKYRAKLGQTESLDATLPSASSS